MTKNNLSIILPIVLMLDLLIPFLLAPSYKGYHHLTQVMSVLGNDKAPLHLIYNGWLVIYGIILIISNFSLYPLIAKQSKVLGTLVFVAVLVYAIGGCVLSGFFSVGETKSLETFSQKVHGYGAVIGFMVLTLVPLFLALYGFKAERMAYGVISLICFLCTIIFFTLFVMADKPHYQNTFIAYEGLWQRLSLMFMYIPIGCLYFLNG